MAASWLRIILFITHLKQKGNTYTCLCWWGLLCRLWIWEHKHERKAFSLPSVYCIALPLSVIAFIICASGAWRNMQRVYIRLNKCTSVTLIASLWLLKYKLSVLYLYFICMFKFRTFLQSEYCKSQYDFFYKLCSPISFIYLFFIINVFHTLNQFFLLI